MLAFWAKFIIYPLLGSFLGYTTNWIAITLLFRPKKKIMGIQGILEKRKPEIAKKTASVIREYLLNTEELKKIVDKEKVKNSVDQLIEKSLTALPNTGKKIISKGLREIIYLYFFDKDGFIKSDILQLALSDSDLEKIIEEKIMNYELQEIEEIVKKASGPEISFILLSGAVIGFIVGLIEAFLPI
ncbi:MAG: hypothetical protein A2Y34_15290 [Spirochaetes bacterium GWC1_27_15]|nr:MAG: hypothetical protein A2Z98_01445 [Spirochaetes bacterium GWB1_27_13]OHD25863.1 MAG: hypothetical protein A2Y34_15290 [Spirochaetes bacterium GWC1_27_15]